MALSSNGINFSSISSGTTRPIYSVVALSDRFVFAGDLVRGAIFFDGTVSLQVSPYIHHSGVSNNGLAVFTTNSRYISKTTDGISWSDVDTGVSNATLSVDFLAPYWIFGRASGLRQYSTTLVPPFTQLGTNITTAIWAIGYGYGGRKFSGHASGIHDAISYLDGLSGPWTGFLFPSTAQAVAGSRFVSGNNVTLMTANVANSIPTTVDNGVSWSLPAITEFGFSSCRALIFDGNKFIGSTGSGRVVHSMDGLTWSHVGSTPIVAYSMAGA